MFSFYQWLCNGLTGNKSEVTVLQSKFLPVLLCNSIIFPPKLLLNLQFSPCKSNFGGGYIFNDCWPFHTSCISTIIVSIPVGSCGFYMCCDADRLEMFRDGSSQLKVSSNIM